MKDAFRLDPTASPELPADRAFVVQFAKCTRGELMSGGRVEHIVSGRSGRFGSLHELHQQIRALLEDDS